jgi:xanthine dehydrogenase small subunit
LIRFILNEKEIETDLPPGMVLLDFIRYHQRLVGTKIGCREGDCGACTVLVGNIVETQCISSLQYKSMTCCLMPLGNANGKHIVTVEGINFADTLNPIQQAMADAGATQCGFCTPGFVVSLAGFCLSRDTMSCVSKQDAIAAVDGNICRCTGYKSIERAAEKIAGIMKDRNGEEATTFVAKKKILPEYFSTIKDRLLNLDTTPFTNHHSPFTAVGGGTDLYVQKHDEMTNADIRFVSDEPALNGITREDNKCIIGASATVSDLMNSSVIREAFPDFHRYAKLVSSTPIRNMATIAGNFINASPIGDFTIFFLALDAHLTLALSTSGERRLTPNPSSRSGGESNAISGREIALRNFYKGYKQLDKKPGEAIEKIWFELPGKNTLFNFEKVSKRTNLDIASVNSAISITMNGTGIEKAGISAGGVGPVPMYLQMTSGYLKEKKITEETINGAIEMMKTEISPIADARGSKEYKTLLLGQLIKAHFMKMFPEIATEKLLK